MVVVENVHTKVQSTFTDAEWANIQNKKEWADTFKVVEATEGNTLAKKNVPKEVADLEASKAKTADAESKQASEAPAAESVKATEDKPKAEKPAPAKPKAGNGK